ncbi:MAG: hybrid sensor histidine kinase/response regulator, partial [Alphaproteobacteria bacterium]
MDDLLSEFLTETAESLDVIDVELVKFEQDPNNAGILDNIFRLVHTIKGTCGFLGLPRLESLAHAAETLMGKYRDGAPVTPEGVSLILETIDRLKEILGDLEQTGSEPEGADQDLISQLEAMSLGQGASDDGAADAAQAQAEPEQQPEPEPEAQAEAEPVTEPEAEAAGESETRVGEVSEEELERAFREAEGPDGLDISPATAAAEAAAAAAGTTGGAEPQQPEAQAAAGEAKAPAEAPAKDAKPAKNGNEGGGLK